MKTSSKKWQKIRKIKGLRQFVTWYPRHVSENPGKKELFNTLGIDKFAEVKVSNLSTGMKQRVAIAISLVHDPDIIIYDEPTNGLDIVSSKMVIDYLKELKTNGKTIIISTHIFEVVEKVADRVGIVINGKLEYEDSISRIKKEKSLEDVFFEVYYSKEGEH